MKTERLKLLAKKAYERLHKVRTRASDDERELSDGGRARPRYRSVEHAYRRYKKLNKLAWGLK